jgi:uncharacterized 2Fe-2S/4Fe-4S cluster protein (DUF4445 family)
LSKKNNLPEAHSMLKPPAPDDAQPGTTQKEHSYRIAFPALDRDIDCSNHESLYAAARRNSLRIVGACGGRGTCGSCMVQVQQGRIHREGEGAHKKWVRACKVQPRSDLVVDVAPRSLAPIVRTNVRTGSVDVPFELQPLVRAVNVAMPPATLQDTLSDANRLRRALRQAGELGDKQALSLHWDSVATLSEKLRANDWTVSVRLQITGGALRLIGAAATDAPLLGLAVDMGTTNAAGFLLDLKTGRRLASLGIENPQAAWGADLISRLNHAVKDPGAATLLRHAAVNAIQALAHDLVLSVGADVRDIVDAVVCGNTAMQHLLLGWPVGPLARAPFVAAANEAVDVPASELGLTLASGANLHLAACVGGFVGGDHVTALLATEEIWSQSGVTLVMDIGTNTEISLVCADDAPARIWSASCPSGPALEGGHISCGMRAAEGAIEGVAVVDDAVALKVIGNADPVGLCGSGVLDALSSFLQAGWLDARGRITDAARNVGKGECGKEIVLVPEQGDRPAVAFSQHDVRSVQLAKSAIRTGVQLLCAQAGLTESDIDRFVIAGAFGAYINLDSAIAIGLLPALPRERFAQVGNAAGLGVQQMLASTGRRARAAEIAATCQYLELSTRTEFQRHFLQNIGFTQPSH